MSTNGRAVQTLVLEHFPTSMTARTLSPNGRTHCECGCGGTPSPGKRFIHGHAVRIKGNIKQTVVCGNCGAESKRYPAALRGGRGKFCSKMCAYAARTARAVRCLCTVCGRQVELRSKTSKCQECLSGWTPERTKLLRDLYPAHGPTVLAQVFGKTTAEVRNKAYRLGIKSDRTQVYSRGSIGTRPDLGIFVRSAWEANYARYLNLLVERGEIQRWEYEPKTFWFEAIRRGVRSYKPDFKVIANDGTHQWHEVKGWMDSKSATKLKRMKKYHPAELVIVIDQAWFRQAERSGLSGALPHWERSKAERRVYRDGVPTVVRRTGK